MGQSKTLENDLEQLAYDFHWASDDYYYPFQHRLSALRACVTLLQLIDSIPTKMELFNAMQLIMGLPGEYDPNNGTYSVEDEEEGWQDSIESEIAIWQEKFDNA